MTVTGLLVLTLAALGARASAAPSCSGRHSVVLNLLTYNVALQRVALAGDIIPYVDRRLEELKVRLPEFALQERLDVLALQEVMLPAHAAVLIEALDAAGYDSYRPGKIFPFLASSGVMVAVRRGLPVRRVQFVQFEDRAQYELVAFRGMLALTLDPLPGGPPLTLVGTHLQSMPSDEDTDALEAQRLQILQTGRVLAAETRGGEDAAVALGDFNNKPADHNYALLVSGLGLSDAFAAVRPGEPGHTISPENFLTQRGPGWPLPAGMRIDHVLLRSGKSARIEPLEAAVVFNKPFATVPEGPLYPSDHYGMRAKVRFENCR